MGDERAKKPGHATKVAPGQRALTGLEEEMGYDVCFLKDPRHELFARKVALYSNATRAYMEVFPEAKYNTARTNGANLLAKADIRARVEQVQRERLDRLEVTDQKLIEELAKLAFANEQAFYHEDGRPKLPHELDPHDAAAVQSRKIRVEEIAEGQGKNRTVIGTATTVEFRTHSKTDALQLLMRQRGMLKDNLNLSGQVDMSVKGLLDEVDGKTKDLVNG